MKCFLWTALFLLSLFAEIHLPVAADEAKFFTSYNVIYKVDTSGNTTVTQNIILTNETSNYYPAQYVLNLNGEAVYNLHAFDRRGPIAVIESHTGQSTQVVFNFNDAVAGVGKSLTWTLVYDTAQIAHKNGTFWEITIPPAQIDANTKSYTVGVYVPPEFGNRLYSKPAPNLGNNNWSLTNNNTGIALAYSSDTPTHPQQTYDFVLRYHLRNPNFTSQTSEIALPPDTNYQQVLIDHFEPKPKNIRLDSDGNWIAQIVVPGKSSIDPVVTGSVIVNLFPAKSPESPENLKKYLTPQRYWETLDSKIQLQAHKLVTPKEIYNFVTTHLHYDKLRIQSSQGRLGAKSVLTHPDSAICVEFTDLFVTLARAAGIPAREVDGFGYTQDQTRQPIAFGRDVLHAWPQYYDQELQTWRMVDPTWGNTTGGSDYFDTLDLNHIAFVVRGTSSTFPKPAGAYKIAQTGFGRQTPSKDLEIIPASHNRVVSNSNVSFSLDNYTLFPPLPSLVNLTIANNGPVLVPAQQLHLSAGININPTTVSLPTLPPFSSLSQSLWLQSSSASSSENAIINIKSRHNQLSAQVSLSQKPLINLWPYMLGGAGLIALISIFAIAYRRRLF